MTADDMRLALAPLEDEMVLMQLPGLEAFQLLAGLQLVLRRPDLPPTMGETLLVLGRALQERISLTPAIEAMCEAGWRQAFDVPVAAEPQEERRIIVP